MKRYKLSADAVPEFEFTVENEEQAIAIFAMLTALTNSRRNLHCENAYVDYHNRNDEDRDLSFEEWVGACDMVWCEIIEQE
jgi:hypothetical protein